MWKYDVSCGNVQSSGYGEFTASALVFSDVRFGSLAASQQPTTRMAAFERIAVVRGRATTKNGGQFVTVDQLRDIGQEFINELSTALTSRMAPAIAESVVGENYLMRYYPIDKAIRKVEADLARFCGDR